MKLTDLIREAQEMLEKRGDLNVITYRNHECKDAMCIGYVDYANAVYVTSDYPEFVKQ